MEDLNKTCAVTGHRELQEDFNKETTKKIIEEVILKGYNNFLVGMALGFDTVCFNILRKLKEKHKIKITAVVPCGEQDKYFNLKQKKKYREMLETADEVITLHEKFSFGCMQERNRYLVDNASLLIAYLKKKGGGTFYTVSYAEKQGKEIIMIK